jgi:hypothetical protein
MWRSEEHHGRCCELLLWAQGHAEPRCEHEVRHGRDALASLAVGGGDDEDAGAGSGDEDRGGRQA